MMLLVNAPPGVNAPGPSFSENGHNVNALEKKKNEKRPRHVVYTPFQVVGVKAPGEAGKPFE